MRRRGREGEGPGGGGGGGGDLVQRAKESHSYVVEERMLYLCLWLHWRELWEAEGKQCHNQRPHSTTECTLALSSLCQDRSCVM